MSASGISPLLDGLYVQRFQFIHISSGRIKEAIRLAGISLHEGLHEGELHTVAFARQKWPLLEIFTESKLVQDLGLGIWTNNRYLETLFNFKLKGFQEVGVEWFGPPLKTWVQWKVNFLKEGITGDFGLCKLKDQWWLNAADARARLDLMIPSKEFHVFLSHIHGKCHSAKLLEEASSEWLGTFDLNELSQWVNGCEIGHEFSASKAIIVRIK